MKLQKLAALLLLVSPLFTVQMVHAQDNVHQQVELSALAKLPVKTIVPITAKTKEQAIAQAKVIAANQYASNRLVNVEGITDEEMKIIQKYYLQLRKNVKDEKNPLQAHSIDEIKSITEPPKKI